MFQCTLIGEHSGGSKGGREGRTPPPLRPNSFNFMQFLGEFGKIACSRPPLGGFTPPPWGNPGSVTDNPHISIMLIKGSAIYTEWISEFTN